MKLPRLRSARGLVCAGVALVLAVLALEATRTLRHEYRNELAGILATSDRTAHKLSVRTTEVFDRVNQATLLVKYLQDQGAPPPLSSLRTAGLISDDLVQFIHIADRRGFVTGTTAGLSAGNVADEDFFKRHRREADLDVAIAPVWTNPISGAQGVPVTRRLGSGSGFDGLVAATVNPAALSVAYARTEAKGTVIGVLGADGVFRSRTVDGVHSFGERADPARVVARAAEVRRTGTPYKSPIDGVMRFVSVVKVDKYPLYAVVAVDAENALAAYRHTRDQVVTWAGVVAAATLLTGWLLLTQAQRLDASRRRTKKAEAAFRATLEGSADAVAILEARRDMAGALEDLIVVDCNSLAAALVGRDRDGMLGNGLCELTPSIRAEGLLNFFEQVISTQRGMQTEVQATDPHVAGKWFHHQLVPLENGVAFISRDVTTKKLAEASLAALARSDALTQLANRRHFEEVLDAGRARALRSGETLALLYIDLDGFKAVNDSLGHAAGDAVLVEVARRLKAAVRVTDLVSRLGGDEFAVLAEAAGSLHDVHELSGRILQALRQPHELSGGHRASATPSIGVAIFDGIESSKALCERADTAMYLAKTSGKARHVLARIDNSPGRLCAYPTRARG